MTDEKEITELDDVKLYRLTRPTTLGKFGQRIAELTEIVSSPDIIYEGLFSYFLGTVQQSEYLIPKGMNPLKEFTLVTRNEVPVGFAHWYVRPQPLYMASVKTDFIYVWSDKDNKAIEALINRFVAFGRRHKCECFQVDTYGQSFPEHINQFFESKKLLFINKEYPAFFAQEIKKK